MREMINRWLARRAFNSLITLVDFVPMSCNDHNQFIASLDILRRLMDKDE